MMNYCPFCESDGTIQINEGKERLFYKSGCSNEDCFCYVENICQWFHTEEEAIDAWNRGC